MKNYIRYCGVACFAAALAALSPAPTRAASVLGVTFLNNQLISIDTTTGNGTLVGPLGAPAAPFGLATAGNQLYTYDSIASRVRQIDPTTGATLAAINVGIGPVLGQGGL